MKTVIIGGSQVGKSQAYARLKRRLTLAGYEVFDNGDVVIFDEAKSLQIPRINTGLRERLRATRQGLHNTPDGRIERRKGAKRATSWEAMTDEALSQTLKRRALAQAYGG